MFPTPQDENQLSEPSAVVGSCEGDCISVDWVGFSFGTTFSSLSFSDVAGFFFSLASDGSVASSVKQGRNSVIAKEKTYK